MQWYLLIPLVLAIAGFASVWQSVKNAKTSTDLETGKWFLIGILMVAISAAIILVALP